MIFYIYITEGLKNYFDKVLISKGMLDSLKMQSEGPICICVV